MNRTCFLALILCFASVILSFHYLPHLLARHHLTPLELVGGQGMKLLRPRPHTVTNMKLILLWTSFFGQPWKHLFPAGENMFHRRHCAVSSCELTRDRGRAAWADALIFHIRDIGNKPKKRWAYQRYIFYLHESPSYTDVDLHSFHGFFNWTMTYRFDSDIFMSYGYLAPHLPYNPDKNYAAGKSLLVAWFVSNCDTVSKRYLYAKSLSTHIPVDVYGKCGPKRCAKTADRRCFDMVVHTYKFYLAFENSLCKDYVSEKFFRLIKRDIVLVVMGGADYSQIVPKSAYIDVRDFDGPKQLAAYLEKVNGDDALYNSYFTWRQNFTGFYAGYDPFCALCAKLHNENETGKVYPNIHDWWVTRGNCHAMKIY